MTGKNGMGTSKRASNFSNSGISTSEAFGRNITAIYGLNLALSYENASIDRLEQRLSECTVPEMKKNLVRHMKETREQQIRLIHEIEVLIGGIKDPALTTGESGNSASLIESHAATLGPTNEKGRLPIPEPPAYLKAVMDAVGTDSERDVWESVNDLIIERAETIMYRAGIDALLLLKADKRTIDVLRKNLKEEEAIAKWLEKNNPRIAKRIMSKQVSKGNKREQRQSKEKDEHEKALLSQSA
jgi:ferritin-like metal-binding protein YciE